MEQLCLDAVSDVSQDGSAFLDWDPSGLTRLVELSTTDLLAPLAWDALAALPQLRRLGCVAIVDDLPRLAALGSVLTGLSLAAAPPAHQWEGVREFDLSGFFQAATQLRRLRQLDIGTPSTFGDHMTIWLSRPGAVCPGAAQP